MKRVFAVLAGALLFSSVVFAGGKKDSQFPYGSFDIGYSGSTCGSPTSIAKLKGFFAEEGVNITLVSGSTFEAERAALAAGKTIIENGDFQYFPGVYNGLDVKLIGGLHEGCIKILVPVDSPIRNLQDLKGKTIAVDEIGGTPMSVASVAAGSVGINPQTEITWIPYPNDQIVQSVEKGEVDVAALWDPFATTLQNTGKYRVLVDISEHPLFAGRACCFLFASGKVVRENPGAVAAALRGYHKAVAWIGANPGEAAQLLISNKSVATEDTALVTGLLGHYHYDQHSGSAANARAKDDAFYFAQKLTEIGYLPADLNVQKFVDDIYVDIFALEAAAKKK
ncbi:ABC transporter substrate-binding protein [Leadbettera azotonutricia]|uniref:Extracellular solute-binding protein, family 3 n=1 Tax=Leadbettera azotonutricia (strain ATCC BAA-888 / DSM 13862 / ZAS-9) TaxID=545695 RepID=F5YEL1_LEAAZ|nr:ABC transporter substrate-binding protein [Leadbettera azotonutricia]AEF83457.1 extracellular solute-binding protein, family 3 [Leadbettera azotonutricia ZAS-9]